MLIEMMEQQGWPRQCYTPTRGDRRDDGDDKYVRRLEK
jgi:hypothetical protein